MDFEKSLNGYKKLHRLANYISVAMLYLRQNQLLEDELKKDDIKDRILGHWGTVPGLNFVYGGLNVLQSLKSRNLLYIAGPGHGAPSLLSNLFIEKTLTEFYPEYSWDKEGLKKLIHDFSWPGKFPSHSAPMVPGTILEGGELGYSLSTAFGTVMDNPDLTTVCVIGDGEAETATLCASWNLNKFIIPNRDGVVLPILHLNGYRISGPTVYGTESKDELTAYFKGLGYDPIIVDQYTSKDVYIDFLEALNKSFEKIDRVKEIWAEYKQDKTSWPIIILKTKKGWTCPKEVNGVILEDNNLSHGIPLQKVKEDDNEFEALKSWMESYKVSELFDNESFIDEEVLEIVPKDEYRLGVSKSISNPVVDLKLPHLQDHEFKIFEKGGRPDSQTQEISEYLRDIFTNNKESLSTFRLFSPDESESNLLNDIFEGSSRVYAWPLRKQDKYFSYDGQIVELLSENVLIQSMIGYILSGRNGLIVSYESFLNIISSQLDQYIKYLKKRSSISWRESVSSLNMISTSTLWRQEHNGFTHQNPTLINSLLAKKSDFVRLYFPIDVNSSLSVIHKSLSSKNLVNLITMGKREMPQWLELGEANELVQKGYLEFEWASNYEADPDVVLASCGEYQNLETLAAVDLLNDLIPELKVKVLYFNEFSYKGLGSFDDPIDSKDNLVKVFTKDKDVVFNFHGYPSAIEEILYKFDVSSRFKILGYKEEGTTTTPFDMQVLNGTSRFHVCIEAIRSASKVKEKVNEEMDVLVNYFKKKLEKHKSYIQEFGKDMPEVVNWEWGK